MSVAQLILRMTRNMRKDGGGGRAETGLRPHQTFSFDSAANRQRELLLCCLIQNRIDLCSLSFPFPPQHTRTQPNPPTQTQKDRFTDSLPPLQVTPAVHYFKTRTDSVEMSHNRGVGVGGARYGGGKTTPRHQLSVSGARGEKHLVDFGSKESKPSRGDGIGWEQTVFKTNTTSFVGF